MQWQAQSWSSLEYGKYPRWKVLHYFAKKAYDTMMLAAFRVKDEDMVEVWAVNDLVGSNVPVQVNTTVYTWSGDLVSTYSSQHSLQEQSSACLDRFPVPAMLKDQSEKDTFAIFSMTGLGRTVTHVLYFHAIKDASLPEVTVNADVLQYFSLNNTAQVELTASAVSPWTFLSTSLNGRWSDNGMMLLPNVKTTVTFAGWESFTLQGLQNTLEVQTIRGTYD